MTPLKWLVTGAVFVDLSAIMSLLLVLGHLGGLSLPGCGAGSPCAQAASSVWGKIQVGAFQWPVSYLGLAYFTALWVTWIATRAALPAMLRQLVRLGALVSLGYIIIMVVERMMCPYCLAAHLGNLAFWMTMEAARVPPARPRVAAITMGGVFAVVTMGLGLWDARTRAAVATKAERDRSAATQEIIGQTPPEMVAPPAASSVPSPAPAAAVSDTAATRAEPAETPRPTAAGPPFTGRYRAGPAEAPIRIVMFTDYQCQDCWTIEQQLVKLHASRKDISISIKHFPFDRSCNELVSGTMHANACWAARAAETAGKLWGPDGFWKMHVWLFDRRGVFKTQAELENGIRELGFDPAGFAQMMASKETLEPIRTDIAEAGRLGLHFTPMIFINGVELKGWAAPNALIRTVEEVAATHPPPRSAAADRPPPASAKYVADWRDQPQLVLPADKQEWMLGPAGARVKVVLWGDYREPGTAEADSLIRSFAARRKDVQYVYRHFPFDTECNPSVQERRHPNACRAAKAAEAAGRVGGNEGYWKMHAWLMESRSDIGDGALRAAATRIGLDGDALLAAMGEPGAQANILDDIEAGKKLPKLLHGMPPGLYSLPTIFINGRYVPRWTMDDGPVLDDILVAAVK